MIQDLFYDAFGEIQWSAVAAFVFAIAFFLVGIFRTIEFQNIGIPTTKRRILIAFHLIGSFLFASALVIGGLNFHEDHRTLMFSSFIAAMVFLAPGQFTIGMIMKKAREQEKTNSQR